MTNEQLPIRKPRIISQFPIVESTLIVNSRNIRIVLIISGMVALWLLLLVMTYHGWIHGADHRDFYPRWAGARLVLFEGRDLYSSETTRQMQIMLYGRELSPDRDQQAFAYPAILVPLLLPFWLIGDVEIATAAWEATSVLLLIWALLLARKTWGSAPLWAVVPLVLWYYPVLMIFQAQVTAIPLLALAVGIHAYTARRDVLAGAALVVGFMKPELMLLPALTLLAYALWERRWRVLLGFMIAGLTLFAASLAINGWWIPRWLEALNRYKDYARVNWVLGLVWNFSPLLAALLVTCVATVLVRLRRSVSAVVAASVPLGMLVLPQTLIWGLTMLTLSMVLAWNRRARWGVAAVWLAGWLLALGAAQPDWWRLPSALLPVLTLGTIVSASREQIKTEFHEAQAIAVSTTH